MPRIDNHPLRLARIRAGLTQVELARRAGIARSTLQAMEEGRTNTPEGATLDALARALGITSTRLLELFAQYATALREQGPPLDPRAITTLQAGPSFVRTCRSFVEWRERIAPSPTAFASLLGLNRSVVRKYEQGIRERGMPDTLSTALVTVLGISDEYLVELQRLEPNHDPA